MRMRTTATMRTTAAFASDGARALNTAELLAELRRRFPAVDWSAITAAVLGDGTPDAVYASGDVAVTNPVAFASHVTPAADGC